MFLLLIRVGLHLASQITQVLQQYSAASVIWHGFHSHATNETFEKVTLKHVFNDTGWRRKTVSKLPFEMSHLYHVYETHAILTILLHRTATRG